MAFQAIFSGREKIIFLRHRANAPLSPPSLPCREVTVVLSGSRQRNYFTVKVKSSAYGKPSCPCPGYLVVASHPTQPRSNLKWKLVKVSWCREGIMVGGKRILEVRCGGGRQWSVSHAALRNAFLFTAILSVKIYCLSDSEF